MDTKIVVNNTVIEVLTQFLVLIHALKFFYGVYLEVG